MHISETQGTMANQLCRRNVRSAVSKLCTIPVWSGPTVSKFISTVFRANSNRVIHRNHGCSISTKSKWNFPNRLNFSLENKDPLGLVFLKQNGYRLSPHNFKGYFPSVTASKWETLYHNMKLFKAYRSASRNRRWEPSRLLHCSKNIYSRKLWVGLHSSCLPSAVQSCSAISNSS